LENGTLGDNARFNKPGFICYVDHVVLILFFPLAFAGKWAKDGVYPMAHMKAWSKNYSLMKSFYEYSILAVLYFVCIWAWVLGLVYISVSTSNAIYQLQCVFAVILSVLILKEQFPKHKRIGVFIAFVGITLVVLPPLLAETTEENENDDDESLMLDESNKNAIIGGTLTLLSALLWGAYEVGYTHVSDRKNINISESNNNVGKTEVLFSSVNISDDEDDKNTNTINCKAEGNTQRLTSSMDHQPVLAPSFSAQRLSKLDAIIETMTSLAVMGLGHTIFCIPLLYLLHATGIETFELPTHTAQVQALIVNCVMSFLFDFAFALAIFMTNRKF